MTAPNPAWLGACVNAIREAPRPIDLGTAISKTIGDLIEKIEDNGYLYEDESELLLPAIATAALSVLTPLIESATAERCAEICDREAVALVERLADGAWADPDERDAIESRIHDAAALAAAIRAAFPAKEG